jgi:hypothetical protein
MVMNGAEALLRSCTVILASDELSVTTGCILETNRLKVLTPVQLADKEAPK